MSTLSLVNGAATVAASFHLLIDEILLSNGEPDAKKISELSELLTAADAARRGDTSYEGLLIDSLLRDPEGRPHPDLARLACDVQSRPISGKTLEALENISRRVSDERTALLTRTASW